MYTLTSGKVFPWGRESSPKLLPLITKTAQHSLIITVWYNVGNVKCAIDIWHVQIFLGYKYSSNISLHISCAQKLETWDDWKLGMMQSCSPLGNSKFGKNFSTCSVLHTDEELTAMDRSLSYQIKKPQEQYKNNPFRNPGTYWSPSRYATTQQWSSMVRTRDTFASLEPSA